MPNYQVWLFLREKEVVMLRKIKLLIITVLVLMVTTFQVDITVMAQDNGEEQEFSTDGSTIDSLNPDVDSSEALDQYVIYDTNEDVEMFSIGTGVVEDQSGNSLYLSDIDYNSNLSNTEWKSIMKDANTDGVAIRLIVNGEVSTFDKGMGAHATSNLVYDISNYSMDYTRLVGYLGVDYGQVNKGDGVVFSIFVSDDLQDWQLLKQTEVITANQEALYIDLDVTNVRYLKLYAHKYGNNANDHAVYGGIRLVKTDYDVDGELYTAIQPLSYYDGILAQNSIEKNMQENKKMILLREFVDRIGYQTIQNEVNRSSETKEAIEWLLNDEDGLQLFIEAGLLYNGSGTRTIQALGRLYAEFKDCLQEEKGNVYKKMLIATAVAYCKDVRTYMVTYGGGSVASDPVEKFRLFKKLYDDGRFIRQAEFENYPMELVRYVMDAKMDDQEILWLRDLVDERFPDINNSWRYNGYGYISYVNVGYNQPRFYSEENREMWDSKYKLSQYGINYGESNRYRLWMMMEAGGICWGISGFGMNVNEVQGIASVNTYQPGHEAYLLYSQNKDGKGIWTIWNNVGGWAQSYTRWGANTSSEARLLLGWGQMDFNVVNRGNNTTYILLAQAALNDYQNYLDSMFYELLSHSYASVDANHEQALLSSLDSLDFNLDAIYGLIKAYKARSASEAEWVELAKKIIDTYTYYPAVMVDLLKLIDPYISSAELKAEINILKTKALNAAANANAEVSLQPDACREIARSLLGNNAVELATFSFDGENAGKIVLDPSYDNYELMVRFSLDGGNTWEHDQNSDTKDEYTPNHVISLTAEQIDKIDAEKDITIGLMGIDTNYTIDIKPGNSIGNEIYKNDDEDLLLGANADKLEYSLDDGKTWENYSGGLNNAVRFDGDITVKVRYRAYANYLTGPTKEYRFNATNDTDTSRYLPLKYVSLVEYSTQQSTSNDHAAINFIDGNANTAWHTKFNYRDEGKYYVVSFDRARYINKLTYLPGGQNGRLQAGEIYASMNGTDWELVKSFDGLQNNTSLKTIDLDQNVLARYLKIVATATYGNSQGEQGMYFSGKMLNFYEDSTIKIDEEASISYSIDSITNQNVVATLNLPEGGYAETLTYEFVSNGSYTFHYLTAANEEKTIDATVSWIDKIAPTASLYYSVTHPTNTSVMAYIDDFSEEGVTVVSGSAMHEFIDNGQHDFIIEDLAGNQTIIKAEVTWIDRTLPTATVTYSTMDQTSGSVIATLTDFDKRGVKVISEGGYTHEFTSNDSFDFIIEDQAGNQATIKAVVDWIKSDELGVSFDNTVLTNGNVKATLFGFDDDATFIKGEQVVEFSANGTYEYEVLQADGTIKTLTITVNWIDKEAPVASLRYNIEEWTNKEVIASLEDINEDVIFADGSDGTYVFTDNGNYKFVITDRAGNSSEFLAQVSWIDPTKPDNMKLFEKVEIDGQMAIRLNVDETTISIVSINGEQITSNPFIVTKNGTYTYRLRLNSTGYEFERSIEVDWVNDDQGNSGPVELPNNPQPTNPPTIDETVAEAPQEANNETYQQITNKPVVTTVQITNKQQDDEMIKDEVENEQIVEDEKIEQDIQESSDEQIIDAIQKKESKITNKAILGYSIIAMSLFGGIAVIWLVVRRR